MNGYRNANIYFKFYIFNGLKYILHVHNYLSFDLLKINHSELFSSENILYYFY